MNKTFIHLFDTRRSALNHLYYVAKLVSRITINSDCLIDFERFIPYVQCSLSNLKHGYIKSLTFGFRVFGFDYASTEAYIDIRNKGDIVVKLVATYHHDCFYFELIEN